MQAYRGDDPGAVTKSSKLSVESGTDIGKTPEKGIEFGTEKSKVSGNPTHKP